MLSLTKFVTKSIRIGSIGRQFPRRSFTRAIFRICFVRIWLKSLRPKKHHVLQGHLRVHTQYFPFTCPWVKLPSHLCTQVFGLWVSGISNMYELNEIGASTNPCGSTLLRVLREVLAFSIEIVKRLLLGMSFSNPSFLRVVCCCQVYKCH